jgi:hypothetical protein
LKWKQNILFQIKLKIINPYLEIMTEIQTLEIVDALKTLPAEKIDEVKDFVLFLRERYGTTEPVDESDEWSDEDLQDVSKASFNFADEVSQ